MHRQLDALERMLRVSFTVAHRLELVTRPHPQGGQEAQFLASSTGGCCELMSARCLGQCLA